MDNTTGKMQCSKLLSKGKEVIHCFAISMLFFYTLNSTFTSPYNERDRTVRRKMKATTKLLFGG